MRILDKYILNKIVLGYLLVMIIFMGLHLIADLFTNLQDFLKAKTPLSIIASYYLFSLPVMFSRTSMIALPLSIFFALGDLNRNNEIMSMRASGVSLFKLSAPVITFALLLSLIAFFLQEKTLVYSQKRAEDIKVEYVKQAYKGSKEQRNFVFRHNNQLFFVPKMLLDDGVLKDVIIFKENKDGVLNEKVVCRTITYEDGLWHARDVISYSLDEEGRIIDRPSYWKEYDIALDEKPSAIALKKNSYGAYITFNELKKEIKRLSRTKATNLLNNLIIDFHKKIADPFSHLFIAIGVLPFALEIKKRKVGLSAIAGGIIFGFLYYVIFSISIAMGKAGIVLPALSAWVAPLFFLVMGTSGLIMIR